MRKLVAAVLAVLGCGSDAEFERREKARDEQIASLQQRILRLEAEPSRVDRWWCGDRACMRDRKACEDAHGTPCKSARLAYCPLHIGGLTCAPTLEGCDRRIRDDVEAARDHRTSLITPLGIASAYCVGVE
jgi:hypothetical protein